MGEFHKIVSDKLRSMALKDMTEGDVSVKNAQRILRDAEFHKIVSDKVGLKDMADDNAAWSNAKRILELRDEEIKTIVSKRIEADIDLFRPVVWKNVLRIFG